VVIWKKVGLAGFLKALPLTSLIALALSQLKWQDSAQTVEYAKSIFFAIPLSTMFFIPFLFSNKLNLNFWSCYFIGGLLLIVGYFIHNYIFTKYVH
jgi:hypothetical protein